MCHVSLATGLITWPYCVTIAATACGYRSRYRCLRYCLKWSNDRFPRALVYVGLQSGGACSWSSGELGWVTRVLDIKQRIQFYSNCSQLVPLSQIFREFKQVEQNEESVKSAIETSTAYEHGCGYGKCTECYCKVTCHAYPVIAASAGVRY